MKRRKLITRVRKLVTKMRALLIIVYGLFIGLCLGFMIGYLFYNPRLESSDARIAILELEFAGLQQTISTQEDEILDQRAQISAHETSISSLEVENTSLQADLSQAQAQVQTYKEQLNTQTSQLSSLQERLTDILEITVTQHYDWEYQWQTWYWDLPIELSAYVEYLEKPRPVEHSSWVDMAEDPGDDTYIDSMVQGLNDFALERHFTDEQKLNFVVSFVQSMPYTTDSVTTPYNEYPRYPLETLFNRGGDCEDTSILVAALLDAMGYDVALLLLENAQHMAVGVAVPLAYGSYYEYGGKNYYYLETTGEGWEIGVIPPGIADARAFIYPLD